MSKLRFTLLALIVAAAAAGGGYALNSARHGSSTDTTASPSADAAWRQASFKDLKGTAHRLDEWSGRVLVLNFWATWCPPCRREIPAFVDLQRRYQDAGLQFVGIALDEVANVQPFIAEERVNYPMLIGGSEITMFMQTLGNGVGALPFTVVIDRSGKVLARHQGEWQATLLDAYLLPLLAPAEAEPSPAN